MKASGALSSEGDLTSISFWEEKYAASRQILPMPWRSRNDSSLIELLKRYAILPPKGRVLELGCGDSYWLAYFAKFQGLQVSGIDYSPQRSARVRQVLARMGMSGEILCGDFRDVPRAWEHQFDLVFSAGVIEHFTEPAEILRTFARYVKPGGLMVTTVPNLTGLWGLVQRAVDPEIYSAHRLFDLHELCQFHVRAGLSIIRAKYCRWADPSVVNYGSLRRPFRKFAGGICYFVNLALRALDEANWAPFGEKYLSANLAVVARMP